jgi:hypothetical protein
MSWCAPWQQGSDAGCLSKVEALGNPRRVHNDDEMC